MLKVTLYDADDQQLTTRQFNQGQEIVIKCHETSSLGIPSWNQETYLSIQGGSFPPIYQTALTNFWGDCEFHIVLPVVNSKATLLVTDHGDGIQIGADENYTLPISIGNVSPDPVPTPSNILTYVLIGAAALIVGAIAVKKL
jgi:hypothetical protein